MGFGEEERTPLDMAVDELDTRVIGLEPEGDVASGLHTGDITPHWDGGSLTWVVVLPVDVSLRCGSSDDLELVAVEMPGVTHGSVSVVDDDFDDVAVLNGKGVGVDTVDGGVHLVLLRYAQGRVEGWDLLRQVGDVVDDGARNAVNEGDVEVQDILLGDGAI